MIVGKNFAYGHLPKTGGDAAIVYFNALTECICDPPTDPRKHDSFWRRKEVSEKEYLLLGIRELPYWTWSLMHELWYHQQYGHLLHLHKEIQESEIVDVDFALSRPWGDMFLLAISCGVRITHWIKAESLFEDILEFVRENVNEVDLQKVHDISLLPTKERHDRSHPFTKEQVVRLYSMNPHWLEIEKRVYLIKRWNIINTLIEQNGYSKYLEIGLREGVNFNRVVAKHKVSVDPKEPLAVQRMTSDEFFSVNQQQFDIIFIDGDHDCQQVLRDMENARRCLATGGTIVMHDCSPPNQQNEELCFCGTVWKAWAEWRMSKPDLDMRVVDADYGCGIIREGRQVLHPRVELLDYEFLENNRRELLNLVSPETIGVRRGCELASGIGGNE